MMEYFYRALGYEFAKIYRSKVWWVVIGVVIVIQPLLALIEAISIAKIGITATPLTHPELAVALPALDYFGFDVVLFGQVAVVVLGGLEGAEIFQHHELRVTLLALNKRGSTFLAKFTAVLVASTIVSLTSIFITIATTHIGLGNLGLNPALLSPIAWEFICYATLDWVLLIALSFGLGMLSRNAIVPLFFMIPQVVGLGAFLAEKWEWCGYLPVAVGNLLFAIPTDNYPHDPLKGGLILTLWAMVALIISRHYFIHRDVGGQN